jgi:type I restriction enzyme M protein
MAKKTAKKVDAASSAETALKAIDDLLWKPGAGCNGALDYMEQSSWLLFLRYLDAHEEERKWEAGLTKMPYEPVLPKRLRWSSWAYPTAADGTFDYERALKGDELIRFVKDTLFPSLQALKDDSLSADTIQYRIGAIFEKLTCKFEDGYLLREVIELMQPLKFQSETDRHEMSVAYESRLGEMGNAGRDGGQYYTPRPLIRVMIRLLDPHVGETFDDGACGSGGFICEAYTYMREHSKNDAKAYQTLQKKTFTGGEVKSLAYVTAQMNCILHGLEAPNIKFGDTLANKIAEFSERDRVHVIGANPPFGAGANKMNQQNFTITTSETALMFMEYFIAKLKRGGRAAIIIKNTFLSNTDAASVAVRRLLLERCQLRWVLDLPQKVFAAGVHTVVLFFTKDGPTTKPINYYQLDLKGVSLGKTRPLREEDLAEFEGLAKGWFARADARATQPSGGAAWTVDVKGIDPETLDLSVNNPNVEEEKLPTVAECCAEIEAIYKEMGEILKGGL